MTKGSLWKIPRTATAGARVRWRARARVAMTFALLLLVAPSAAVLKRGHRGRGDGGLTTLEIVIWGLGLFLAATAAIAVITQAIDSRTSKIS